MKNRIAAFGAAFLLLGSLFLIPAVRIHAAASFTSLIDVWVQNSKIDSSPIGQSVQASGQFTSLASTSGALNGVIGNLTPNVATFTTVTGTSFSGLAGTATALAATPTQCSGGTVTTGIAASGNANCTAKGAVTGTQVLLPNQSVCTPATSTDAQCSGSITFASLGDTLYTVSATVLDSSGADLLLTMTSKSATGFNYVLACTFNCSTYGGPTADIRIFHP